MHYRDHAEVHTQAGASQQPVAARKPRGASPKEVNDMEAINAGNAMSVYLPFALYAIISIVGWRLMKRQRKSKTERATYWQACYIKLDSLAVPPPAGRRI
jgi:hypothetical protein